MSLTAKFAEYGLFYRALLQKRPIGRIFTIELTSEHHKYISSFIMYYLSLIIFVMCLLRYIINEKFIDMSRIPYTHVTHSFAEYSLFYRALLQKRPIGRHVTYTLHTCHTHIVNVSPHNMSCHTCI